MITKKEYKEIKSLKKELEEKDTKLKLLSESKYDFELDKKGNLLVVYTNRRGRIRKEKVPNNSITKYLLNQLEKAGDLPKRK